ncbi:MAG: RidA family protein [Actinomycetota bacterium]
MPNTIANPAGLHDPTPFGYSHSVRIAAGSELVVIAGQYGSGPDGSLASTAFADQVGQSFHNLGLALAAHELDLTNVVQLRTYVVDHDFDKLGIIVGAIAEAWGARPPANTLIGVAALATPDLLFEVEAMAARP